MPTPRERWGWREPGRAKLGGAVDRTAVDGLLLDAAGEVEAFEDELDRGRDLAARGGVAVAEAVEDLGQPRNRPQLRQHVAGGDELTGLDDGTLGEHGREAREVETREPVPERRRDRQAEQV